MRSLIYQKEYLPKVLPFLKEDYFEDSCHKVIYKAIHRYTEKYSRPPTEEALEVIFSNQKGVNEQLITDVFKTLKRYKKDQDEDVDMEWLIDETEKFCRNRAIFNAIQETVDLYTKNDVDGIPLLLQDALAVGFNNDIGHDYFADAENRYEYYHKVESKLPFGLKFLDIITNGGLSPKTLTVFMAATNVGKSLIKCALAANHLKQGKNVLYITLEMAEEKIAHRIDSNLFEVDMDIVESMPKTSFTTNIDSIRNSTNGRLIIKEYPPVTVHAGHFRNLLNELRLKKNFVPDVIYIDYLNLALSQRVKGGNANSYTIVKSVAEELRGIAVEFKVPIVTSTQTNRSGYDNSDMDLTHTSESIGLPATADLFLAIMRTEELDQLNQLLIKQLKNRYSDLVFNRKFTLGVDRSKMKLYDVSDSAQFELDGANIKLPEERSSESSKFEEFDMS